MKISGNCRCKINVEGKSCDTCKPGFFNLTSTNPYGCDRCVCYANTTERNAGGHFVCNFDGDCKCLYRNVQGPRCNRCAPGTYDLDSGCSKRCDCDPYGSLSPNCDQTTGQCKCKANIVGLQCTQCSPGFYNLTSYGCLNQCNCNKRNSIDTGQCELATGQCKCLKGYGGRDCSDCLNGYWRASENECRKCDCNVFGLEDLGNICDQVSRRPLEEPSSTAR